MMAIPFVTWGIFHLTSKDMGKIYNGNVVYDIKNLAFFVFMMVDIDKRLHQNCICGLSNLAFCRFLLSVDVGNENPVVTIHSMKILRAAHGICHFLIFSRV